MTTKFNLQTKFQANGSRLYVKANGHKSGITVSVSLRNPAETKTDGTVVASKLQTGCITEFPWADKRDAILDRANEVKATAKFNELVDAAKKQGWIERVKKIAAVKTPAFLAIPAAPKTAPVVVKADDKKADKKADKK